MGSIKNKMCKAIFGYILISFILSSYLSAQNTNDIIFEEDYEVGSGSWWADNGLWEVGEPSAGPTSTKSGSNCVGTVLDANYSSNANTRLISPSITLPSLSDEETIQLKFWQWFDIENGDDRGVVQISENSGEWQTLSNVDIDGRNPTWSQYIVDLSSFAGSSIRLGFYFQSNPYHNYNGWYIDDVSIETLSVTFSNPEDFESGIGNWWADNGLWEVGEPIAGPISTHSGSNCAGTVLAGDYSSNANTRLISPEIIITPVSGQTPMMFFYQWFIIENNDDRGRVQISVNGGAWESVSNPITSTNEIWSQYAVDLSSYVNKKIRISFYFTSNPYHNYSGWYIDDIRFEGIVTDPVGVNTEQVLLSDYSQVQNYPNPFNPTTSIEYSLATEGFAKLTVFNCLGQELKTLVNEIQNPGRHLITFDAGDLSSGVYIYQLSMGNNKVSKKMIVLK